MAIERVKACPVTLLQIVGAFGAGLFSPLSEQELKYGYDGIEGEGLSWTPPGLGEEVIVILDKRDDALLFEVYLQAAERQGTWTLRVGPIREA